MQDPGQFLTELNWSKQRVSKKQKAEIESDASSGGQGKYITYLNSQRLPAEAAL